MKILALAAAAIGAVALFGGNAQAVPPCSTQYTQCNKPAYGGPASKVCQACIKCAKRKGKFYYNSQNPRLSLCKVKIKMHDLNKPGDGVSEPKQPGMN